MGTGIRLDGTCWRLSVEGKGEKGSKTNFQVLNCKTG